MFGEMSTLVRKDHLPTRIAGQFSQSILNGTLKTGDRLPTEHAMAKSFGVSRTVIREAIAQLRNEGLVETRQGIGAFVTERPVGHIRLQDSRQLDSHGFRDLFQLRVPLEIEAAGLAARHRSNEHIADLDRALARMAAPGDWAADGVDADLQFHGVIAAATGNDYFVQFIGAISDRIRHVILTAREQLTLEDIVARTIDEHGAIREAIAAGDATEARGAMRTHLIGSANRVGLQLEFFG